MSRHTPIVAAQEAVLERSFRIEYRHDFTANECDWRLLLTGKSVGGYGTLTDTFGGKYRFAADAERAGSIFVQTGVLPAHQREIAA